MITYNFVQKCVNVKLLGVWMFVNRKLKNMRGSVTFTLIPTVLFQIPTQSLNIR